MENTTTARPRRSWRQAAAGITALAALTLTACASDPEPAGFTDPTESSGEQSEQAAQATESSTGGGQDGGSADAEVAAASMVDPADADQTLTYEIPSGEIDGTMTVGLHHLQQNGETLELMLTFTPEFQGEDVHTLWELHAKKNSLVAPSLYDRENLKRYSILQTSGGNWDERNWATPPGDTELASGQTQAYYANFAAPEDQIDSLNVGLPGGGEFDAVTIEQGS